MPEYSYRCIMCNQMESVTRSIFADEIIPQCCGQMMGRAYDTPVVKFNAPGFYSTGG